MERNRLLVRASVEFQMKLWPSSGLRTGHPAFDLSSVPLDVMYFDAPDITSFGFEYSAYALRVAWGRSAETVADGRVRYGLDIANWLVAIGLQGLTAREADMVAEVIEHSAAHRGTRPE